MNKTGERGQTDHGNVAWKNPWAVFAATLVWYFLAYVVVLWRLWSPYTYYGFLEGAVINSRDPGRSG